MRISKIFNLENQAPLVVKTLANDAGSVAALGVADHLATAKAYFDDPQNPPTDPNHKEYRDFALPILDALAQTTDPTFQTNQNNTNPSSENFDWIMAVYAATALDNQTPIESDDLQKIREEILYLKSAQNALEKKQKPTNVHDYPTYAAFTDVIRPMMSKNIELLKVHRLI